MVNRIYNVLASFEMLMPKFNVVSPSRLIYTESYLNIDGYIKWRHNYKWCKRIGCISKVNEILNLSPTNEECQITQPLFRDFLRCVETSDLDLLEKVLKTVHRPTHANIGEEGRRNNGLTVCNLLYFLGMTNKEQSNDITKKAIAIITDPDLQTFFNTLTGYCVILQLLYNIQKYDEVIKIFEFLEMNRKGYTYNCVTLFLLSCYHLNNSQTLRLALDLVVNLRTRHRSLIPRHAALVGSIALQQDRPEIAWEICQPEAFTDLSAMKMGMALRSVQVISLARLHRVHEAIDLTFHYYNRSVNVGRIKLRMCIEAIDALLDAVHKMPDQKVTSNIIEYLFYIRYTSRHLVLEELFLKPVFSKVPNQSFHKDTRYYDAVAHAIAKSSMKFHNYNRC